MKDMLGTNPFDAVRENRNPLLECAFNTNQIEAYNWDRGPLLVLAGPGSGKTDVLTHRIARLIKESEGQHFQILGLTFTRKAAVEMQKRVNSLASNADKRTNITTYHSFAAAILRQHGHHLGINPDFVIMTQDEERGAVLDRAVAAAGLDHVDGYDGRRLLGIITRLTERNIMTDATAESLGWMHSDTARQIGDIYRHYRKFMIKQNELDFGALVSEAVKLLAETASIGKMIRRIYPYVCVDEFQDTNDAQYQMLCNLVDPSTRNLFVVADGDQTIYEWDGASQGRIGKIQERFDMDVCELPKNYRCPANVVGMANKLIKKNSRNGRTDSVPHKLPEQDRKVQVMGFDTADAEAKWVAEDIAALPENSRANCAVLARTRSSLERVIDALKKFDMHGHLHSKMDKFTNDRMLWFHSVLKLANSRRDERHLLQMCKSFYALEGIDLVVDEITSNAVVTGDDDFLRAWHGAALCKDLAPATRSFLSNEMPRLIDRLDAEGFAKSCFSWFEQRQISNPAPDYNKYEDERRIWDTLVSEIKISMGLEQVTLSALLQQINLRSKTPPPPKRSIPCYTIFASKGMQFDHVYLIGLVEGELPDWRAVQKGDGSRELQEERRICFVAVTRSQKSLTMTYPLGMHGTAKKRSRFLDEMGADVQVHGSEHQAGRAQSSSGMDAA